MRAWSKVGEEKWGDTVRFRMDFCEASPVTRWLGSKELACNAGTQETWVRSLGCQAPRRRKCQPTPVFSPGKHPNPWGHRVGWLIVKACGHSGWTLEMVLRWFALCTGCVRGKDEWNLSQRNCINGCTCILGWTRLGRSTLLWRKRVVSVFLMWLV